MQYTSTTSPLYPCDRGIPGNLTARGYHNYQSGPTGAVCCTLCGAYPFI